MARLIAYLLEFAEGIEFSRGISSPDEPAIAVRDLTGALRTWVDIGTPAAERLHKASKVAARVAVCTHKDSVQFLKQLAGTKIHNAAANVSMGFKLGPCVAAFPSERKESVCATLTRICPSPESRAPS